MAHNEKREFPPFTGIVGALAVAEIPVAIKSTLLAPLDRTRFVLQTQMAHPVLRAGETTAYRGMFRTMLRLAREQGVASLWRGNLVSVVSGVPVNVWALYAKVFVASLVGGPDPASHPAAKFAFHTAAGAAAGALAVIVSHPVSLVRMRLATDLGTGPREFTGAADAVRKIVRNGGRGVLSLYTGLLPMSLAIVPYRAMHFGMYDTLRLLPLPEHPMLNLASKFGLAQLTAVVASSAAYPLNTVGWRLALQANRPRDQWVYKGMLDCFRVVLREEGVRGFYRGFGVQLVSTFGAAFTLVVLGELGL